MFIYRRMPRTFWHRAANRPIRRDDDGRFVLGKSASGWVAGYVADTVSGVCVDTGPTGAPLTRMVAANALRIYTFLDAPPPWNEATSDVPDRAANVVRLRDRQ